MTNEFVVGENRYDPMFGQPSSLDKISFTGTPGGQHRAVLLRQLSAWSAPGNSWTTSPTSAAPMPSSSESICAASAKRIIAASVAGLNSNEEVNFSTAINTVDPTTFGLPADLNTSFDRPNFQSDINFMLGRVGQIDRGFVNQNGQWTKSNFKFDTRYPEYEFYGAGHLESRSPT